MGSSGSWTPSNPNLPEGGQEWTDSLGDGMHKMAGGGWTYTPELTPNKGWAGNDLDEDDEDMLGTLGVGT